MPLKTLFIKLSGIISLVMALSMYASSTYAASCENDAKQIQYMAQHQGVVNKDRSCMFISTVSTPVTKGKNCTAKCQAGPATPNNRRDYICSWQMGNWGDTIECSHTSETK